MATQSLFISSSSSSTSQYWRSTNHHGGKGRVIKRQQQSSSNLVISRHNQEIRAIISTTNKKQINAMSSIITSASSLPDDDQQQKGLGIENFLSGKTWFITGATGFLGKVLVEKILRSIPDTRKIYVMMKAKDTEAALHRLKTEIIEAEVFRVLKEEYGPESYEAFMLTKLVPVVGDLGQGPGLGIEAQTADMVAGKVDLIVNSAANTTFDEGYDLAINTNTVGAMQLMRFADKCSNLKLFLHVSSIYANGGRNGAVMEKPFRNGDATTVAAEIQLALNHSTAAATTADDLKRLGLEPYSIWLHTLRTVHICMHVVSIESDVCMIYMS